MGIQNGASIKDRVGVTIHVALMSHVRMRGHAGMMADN